MKNDLENKLDSKIDNNNEKKLRIGIFTDAFFPMIDGVVNVVDNYAKRLCSYADVTVFAPSGREDYDDSKFPYKVVRCKKKLALSFLDYDLPMPSLDKDFLDELKNAKLDIVHIHSPFSIGKLGVKYAKKKNIPVVATLHSQFKKDFYLATKSDVLTSILLKNVISVFNSCYECWAVNKEVAKVYFKEYKLERFPKVQNNGTDLAFYSNDEEIEKLRKHYNIDKDTKILLFVGRINRIKNIFFTLDCLKILKEKNFKFKMIFVGTGPDLDELKERVKQFGLEDYVITTGKICDRELMVKHYRLADLFVFPSLYDCSSLVQIEAASQQTPTIFIKGAVTSGTCTEGVDAFFADDDVKKFANRILEIFENEEEYEKIKNGAFNNLYVTWDDAVKKVYNDYLRVIEQFNAGYYDKFSSAEYKSHKRKIKGVVNKECLKTKRYKDKKKKTRLKEIKKSVQNYYKQDKKLKSQQNKELKKKKIEDKLTKKTNTKKSKTTRKQNKNNKKSLKNS